MDALRRAAALRRRVAARPARTEIHGRDELKARRERRTPGHPHDGDDAVLERLPQRLEHGPRELRELVEEQHAEMREARLAGSRPAATAADHGGIDDEWCGARNGGTRISPPPGSSTPATEWIRVTSSASSSPSSGRMPGRRRASIVLPVPGGPASRTL